MEGNVKVRCEVSRDGSLKHSVVTGSSGHTMLDNAALSAVRNVRQFPPMPLEQYGDKLAFEVPITFRLSAE
jgi:TonB family protein